MAQTITILRVEPHDTDATAQPEAHLIDVRPNLKWLRGALDDGWLEAITLGHDAHAYVDEEGKIKGLPINGPATALARALGWPDGDLICGPALFVGHSYGDEVDVPDEVLTAARKLGLKVVDLR